MVAMLLNSKGLWGGSDLNPGTYRSTLSKQIQEAKSDDFAIDVESILFKNGWKGQDWFLNDWQFLKEFEFWDNQFPRAKWLLVRREPAKILHSCSKTQWMNNYLDAPTWEEWLERWHDRIKSFKNANIDYQEVWPTKFIEGDYTEIKQVMINIGVQYA